MKNLSVSLIQTNLFWEDAEKNLAHFSHLLDQIDQPIDLIVLPETFNTGFTSNPFKCAESMFGETIQFLKKRAQEKDCLIIGSLLVSENHDYYNRLIAVYPDGRMDTYDKRHLFRLSKEFENITQGKEKLVLEWRGWKIQPLVCYDLRFPVWSKNRLINGAYEYDLLVYVANWPASRSLIWKSLLPARAIENQCYSLGVNRIGRDGQNTPHAGDSLIAGPDGKLLAHIVEEKEEMLHATLSKTDLERFRTQFPFAMDWDQFTIQP